MARPVQWLVRCPDRCTRRVSGKEGLHQVPLDRGARIQAGAAPLGCHFGPCAMRLHTTNAMACLPAVAAYSGACSRMKLSVAK